jgi:hypothetical protein
VESFIQPTLCVKNGHRRLLSRASGFAGYMLGAPLAINEMILSGAWCPLLKALTMSAPCLDGSAQAISPQ